MREAILSENHFSVFYIVIIRESFFSVHVLSKSSAIVETVLVHR